MQAAGVDTARYFLFVCGLVRTYMDQEKPDPAFKAFCDELSGAVKRQAVAKHTMPLIRMAEHFNELNAEQKTRLQNVLTNVARAYCGDEGAEFAETWAQGPRVAVSGVLNQIPF